ncbi:MAG: hypothetical protein FWF10_04725 [Clostridiales bacterium]|nr:hypothetical protein [Clostridiales bacterium]
MQLQPVKKSNPQYPEAHGTDLQTLLRQNAPLRWKRSAPAMALLGALTLTTIAGCRMIAPPLDGDMLPPETTRGMQTEEPLPLLGRYAPPEAVIGMQTEEPYWDIPGEFTPPESTRTMQMAPIFPGELPAGNFIPDPAPGEKPPVKQLSLQEQGLELRQLGNFPMFPYLSEADALQIITTTLEEAGLTVTTTQKQVFVPRGEDLYSVWTFDLAVAGAAEPVYIEWLPSYSEDSAAERAEREALLPTNTSKGGALDGAVVIGSNFHSFNTKRDAEQIREQLTTAEDASTGAIFYMQESALPELSLRAQVREFVEWLKTVGLI